MLSFVRWTLFFIVLFVTVIGGALVVGHEMLVSDGPLAASKRVVIPRGAGPATMAKVLKDEGVLTHPGMFRVALMIDPVIWPPAADRWLDDFAGDEAGPRSVAPSSESAAAKPSCAVGKESRP